MGRFKLYNMESYVELCNNGLGKCLLCSRLMKAHMGNVKRHYNSIHRQVILPEDENSSPTSKKRKIQSVKLRMDKEEFMKSVVKTITEMNMPFRNFNNEAFQNLLQPWTDAFGIKYNSKSIGVCINEMANLVRLEISAAVSKKYICLKLDIASRMERSIMGVNIQFISKNFEVIVYTVEMVELLERHHANYLKQQVLDILEKYNINISQVYSVTTDNGANVIKTSKLLQEYLEYDIENEENFNDEVFDNVTTSISETLSVVHCAAHTLQLAAWDVIKKLKDNINSCREKVKDIRKKMRESNASPLPVLDNTTRWSSTYEMIKSLVETKIWIESNNNFTIEVDWNFANQFKESFKPIADATTLLQYKELVMGDFYREWLLCEAELEEISNSNHIAKLLLYALKKRKEVLVDNKAFISAIYMDQRFCFKGSNYINEDQKKAAISHLLTIYNKLKLSGEISENINEEGRFETNMLPNNKDDRYRKLEIKTAQSFARRTDGSSIQKRLENLQYEEKLPFSSNILSFWKSKSFKDHIVSKIAEVALAVPATQVSVERAFSALPIIMTKHRRNLTAEHLENILLLKLNPTLIEKISC